MSDSTHHGIRAVCIEGFRRNRVPALVLQAFAAALLALYFLVPPMRPGFEAVGELKTGTDPWFAMVSTSLFAGFIPWLVLCHRGRIGGDGRWKHFAFLTLYWAMQGAVVDALYTWQDRWFGSGNDWPTLAVKTLVDQGPFNLIYATPLSLVMYGWKDAGFSWSRFREQNPWPRLRHRYAVIQVSVWIVWIPAVTMIYCLPPELQIPLFNFIICFFSLLLAFVSRG